jgi:protein-disulfide isomerase
MSDSVALSPSAGHRQLRAGLYGLAAAFLLAVAAHAQFGAPPTTPVHDPAALKPPPGAKVAIVEFDDMECPDCAAANPVLKEAAAKYKIPWIRHDFPLPYHAWGLQASINARWFDTKSKQLGDEYRDYIFANQRSIETLPQLTQWTQRYAQSHGQAFPFAVDPQGKLAALVKADYELGQRIGIEHTPTIWIVTDGTHSAPFIEIVDRTKLYQIIDTAIAQTSRGAAATAPAKTAKPKPAPKK